MPGLTEDGVRQSELTFEELLRANEDVATVTHAMDAKTILRKLIFVLDLSALIFLCIPRGEALRTLVLQGGCKVTRTCTIFYN